MVTRNNTVTGTSRATGSQSRDAPRKVANRPERCTFCQRAMPGSPGVGRPRIYCRRSCRQRAFEQRRRQSELSWGDERTSALIEISAQQSDRLAHVGDVLDELRADVDDQVSLDVTEALDRLEAALGRSVRR